MPNLPDAYGRDLDLNLLRVFAVVAEEGSITRAAARLYVTQPAVSAAMRRLATFVGSELFAREGRGIVLTARGVELLAAARTYLQPLVAAALAGAGFDPKSSTATVRIGLADSMEALLLPTLLRLLREEAPGLTLVVLPVQFRTVGDTLLQHRVDLAVTVADDLPRSILRQPLTPRNGRAPAFVCLYDPRFLELPKKLTERLYFAQDHVVVSYAGDVRGIVEDATAKARRVRVSVPSLGGVAEVVDGSSLVATVPALLAAHVRQVRPHLRIVPLPFRLPGAAIELLWTRTTDDDPTLRFVRELVPRALSARVT